MNGDGRVVDYIQQLLPLFSVQTVLNENGNAVNERGDSVIERKLN